MKRFFVVFAIGGALLGAAFASAAALNLDPNAVHVGEDTAVCQPDGEDIGVRYVVELPDNINDAPGVTVRVFNVHEDCEGLKLVMHLHDENGDVLPNGKATVDPIPGDAFVVFPHSQVDPTDIYDVRIAIHSTDQ